MAKKEEILIQDVESKVCFIPRVNAQPFFHGSLFSGIGGFDLAAEWAGWQNSFHCEWNEFGQKILKYYWPNATSYGDITKTDFTIHRGAIDVLTGGFPCQDISIAGHQKGLNGQRSGLFFEYIRAVDECRPKYAIWENVSEVRKHLHTIGDSFSEIGYCLSWHSVHASWFGFPHQRERVFGVAYNTDCFGWEQIQIQTGIIEKKIYEASKRELSRATGRKIQLENYAEFLRNDDGIPTELAVECIKAYGNAIIPQIALIIFDAINVYRESLFCAS